MAKKGSAEVPGKAITKWDAKLAELAKQTKKAAASIGTGGNFLSLKGGHLSYQGQVIPGDRMRCVVVDWVLHNVWFDGAYDEENVQSPACYAFGREKEAMAPDAELVDKPQHDTCAGCPKNEWGSAEKGRGKACAETARLALIAEGDFGEIEAATEAYLKVPTTSMSFWGGYVRDLSATYNRPPLAFITEISIVPQAKQPGWHVEFKIVEPIEDDATLGALMTQYDKISAKIAFPYPKFEEAPKPRARAAAVPAPAAPKASATRKVGVPPRAENVRDSQRISRGNAGAVKF